MFFAAGSFYSHSPNYHLEIDYSQANILLLSSKPSDPTAYWIFSLGCPIEDVPETQAVSNLIHLLPS